MDINWFECTKIQCEWTKSRFRWTEIHCGRKVDLVGRKTKKVGQKLKLNGRKPIKVGRKTNLHGRKPLNPGKSSKKKKPLFITCRE